MWKRGITYFCPKFADTQISEKSAFKLHRKRQKTKAVNGKKISIMTRKS
jgi:hypothetical protein